MVRMTKNYTDPTLFAKVLQNDSFKEVKNNKTAQHLIADTLSIVTNEEFTLVRDREDIDNIVDEKYIDGQFENLLEKKRDYQNIRNLFDKLVDMNVWDSLDGVTAEDKTLQLHEFLDYQTQKTTGDKNKKFLQPDNSDNSDDSDDSDGGQPDTPNPNDSSDDIDDDAGQVLLGSDSLGKVTKDLNESLDALSKGSGMCKGDLERDNSPRRVLDIAEKLKDASQIMEMFYSTMQLINTTQFKTPEVKIVKSMEPTDDRDLVLGDDFRRFTPKYKSMDEDLQLLHMVRKTAMENNYVKEEGDIGTLTIAVDVSTSMNRIIDDVLGLAFAFAKTHTEEGIESRIVLFNTNIVGEFKVEDWEKYLDVTTSGCTDIAHVLTQLSSESSGKEEFLFITDAEDDIKKHVQDQIRTINSEKLNRLHTMVINTSATNCGLENISDKYYTADSVKHLQEILIDDLDDTMR